MKLLCLKNELKKAINIAKKASNKKSNIKIFSCILIDSTEEKIKLMSNNIELGIITTLEGEIIEPGKCLIDADLIDRIVSKLPEKEITLETEIKNNNFLTYIYCDDIKYNIEGFDENEFNIIKETKLNNPIIISEFNLKRLIKSTIFSVQKISNNKIMTGELFKLENNILSMTSLDGHRISIRRENMASKFNDVEIIIPYENLNIVENILTDSIDKMVEIYIDNNTVIFIVNNSTIISNTIEGKYFNIMSMISNDYETKISINRELLIDSLIRSQSIDDSINKKPIILNINNEKLNLSLNIFNNSWNEEIDIFKEGKDLKIGLNPNYLLEALKNIEDEEIDIYMTNPVSPCYIKDNENSFLYLILPINIQ